MPSRSPSRSRPEDRPFVFYEGPPTANGRPGFHHALARAFKDLIPRYKTMRGYRVERKGGWDCHGLPVEIQGRERARPRRQGGHRALRRRGVQPPLPRVRLPLRGGLAEDERAARLLGGHGGPLPHARRLLHRERLVGPEDPAREGPPLRGLQGQPPLPARPDLPLLRRGRPRLPAVPRPRGRPERLREAAARRRGEHEPPRLDHDAVDPHLQRRRRRQPRRGLRHRQRSEGNV